MKLNISVVRLMLLGIVIVPIYLETGWATALALSYILVALHVMESWVKKVRGTLDLVKRDIEELLTTKSQE